MFTSKCIKEKLQFSEFINGLEKGHVSSWKAGLKMPHMLVEITHPRFIQSTSRK